jgi:hypothetical protein
MGKPAPPAEILAADAQPSSEVTTSSSEYESGSNTGNDGDEESVTSEEEFVSSIVNASTEAKECDAKTKEKWVSIKCESTPETVPAAAAVTTA